MNLIEYIKHKNRIVIHTLVWIILIAVLSLLLFIENRPITPGLYYGMGLSILYFYINYSILVPKLLLKKKTVLYVIGILILLIISYYISLSLFPSPPRALRPGNPGIHRGIKPPLRFVRVFFTLILVIIGSLIRVYEQWVKNDRNKKEIEAQKDRTELEALKNQLNPHFLFNSLNSIYSLTVKKSNDAPEAVIMLSELMRYMLYKANDNSVLLKDELQYIENYIKLQRIRIAKNEHVKTNIRGAVSTQKISPLLFISYIENAFKYGTDFNGNTEVQIDISVKDEELQFKCINLIGSKNKDEENSGIGMQNAKERLQLLYPERHWLTIEEKGNRFIVDLKLKLD